MTDRPAWTLARAADECGVSRDTIKRRRASGAFPNAYQAERGAWMIPITDLLSAGFQPDTKSRGPESVSESQSTRSAQQLEHENELLRVRLESEQALRAMAEQAASDLRASLRMLDSANTRKG